MYQAIVFLPLLGAVLAAIIALAGARGRCPGEGPPPGAEDDATDHGPHLGGPSVHEAGAVIHHAHYEPEEHEPAAAG